jgi:hypothetical protein
MSEELLERYVRNQIFILEKNSYYDSDLLEEGKIWDAIKSVKNIFFADKEAQEAYEIAAQKAEKRNKKDLAKNMRQMSQDLDGKAFRNQMITLFAGAMFGIINNLPGDIRPSEALEEPAVVAQVDKMNNDLGKMSLPDFIKKYKLTTNQQTTEVRPQQNSSGDAPYKMLELILSVYEDGSENYSQKLRDEYAKYVNSEVENSDEEPMSIHEFMQFKVEEIKEKLAAENAAKDLAKHVSIEECFTNLKILEKGSLKSDEQYLELNLENYYDYLEKISEEVSNADLSDLNEENTADLDAVKSYLINLRAESFGANARYQEQTGRMASQDHGDRIMIAKQNFSKAIRKVYEALSNR